MKFIEVTVANGSLTAVNVACIQAVQPSKTLENQSYIYTADGESWLIDETYDSVMAKIRGDVQAVPFGGEKVLIDFFESKCGVCDWWWADGDTCRCGKKVQR